MVETVVLYNNAPIDFEVLVKSHYYIPILLMTPKCYRIEDRSYKMNSLFKETL